MSRRVTAPTGERIRSRLHPARPVARFAARVVEAEGRRGAAVLDGAADAAVGLEALTGHRANLAGPGADAGHPAALVVNDDIGALGVQRPRDRLRRVTVRLLLLRLPHQARIDQRPDGRLVPERLPPRGVIETAVGADVLVAIALPS